MITQTRLVRELAQLRPSPENDKLYRPVDSDDPEVQALAASIAKHGIKEPLVITRDNWIISGHRRYVAAEIAGLDRVPVRVEDVLRGDDRFLILLREYNRQREKSLDEKLREEVISADPHEAYRVLTEFRQRRANPDLSGFRIRGRMERSPISKAKQPMLRAALLIVEKMTKYWPLTVRRIHYKLLESPPLRHASKPNSTYDNQPASYKDLDDLLVRARLAGDIPMEAIADETRPVVVWSAYREVTTFIREELDEFLKGGYRNLMQSQPNHIEIVGEKNTIKPIIHPVAADYTIPYTIGRGYSSLPPRDDLVNRYLASGKEKLVLLMLSDFDAEGEDMNNSFAKSLRDDFHVEKIVPIKVAITKEQGRRYKLPQSLDAKDDTARQRKFIAKHGSTVYEIDALGPEVIQAELRKAVDSVIDVDAFNHEVAAERRDAAHLDEVRQRVHAALRGIGF